MPTTSGNTGPSSSTGTRWWPLFCAAVDVLVAAILAAAILAAAIVVGVC